ncbi:MAG TPA: hypothetical protein VM118_01615 [Acidobacteriota bacterium]|nr:hypothetical protein [Acidobacteriota bacterium]
MRKRTKTVLAVVAGVVVLGLVMIFLYPIVGRWFLVASEKTRTRVVLRIDVTGTRDAPAEVIRDMALGIIEKRGHRAFGMARPNVITQGEDQIVVEFIGAVDCDWAASIVGKTALLEFRLLASPEQARELLDKVDRVLLDMAGLDTSAVGSDAAAADETADLVDELFGEEEAISDPTSSTSTGGPLTTLMEPTEFGPGWLVAAEDAPQVRLLLAREEVVRIIPPDVMFAWATRPEFHGTWEMQRFYLVKKHAEMTGEYLIDAYPSFDRFHKPIVNFELTREGGRAFARLTDASIGKPLAIMLDGRVESAPTIQSRISDRGQITMGMGATYEDAHALAVMLGAGPIPAPVEVLECDVVQR